MIGPMLSGLFEALLRLVPLILLVLFALKIIHKVSARIACRIKDFGEAKNTSVSFSPIVFILFGFVLVVNFPRSMATVLVGSAFVAVPVIWQIRKNGLDFWKILLVRIIGFPFFLAMMFTSAIFVRDKSKTIVDWSGTEVTYVWARPDHIVEGEWVINHVYDIACWQIYESTDGMRCMVGHVPTLRFSDVRQDVMPMYNVKGPLPKWIAWLY